LCELSKTCRMDVGQILLVIQLHTNDSLPLSRGNGRQGREKDYLETAEAEGSETVGNIAFSKRRPSGELPQMAMGTRRFRMARHPVGDLGRFLFSTPIS